jgi:hypothetical protein
MVVDGSCVFLPRGSNTCYVANHSCHAIGRSGHGPFYSTIRTLAFRVLAEQQKEKKA